MGGGGGPELRPMEKGCFNGRNPAGLPFLGPVSGSVSFSLALLHSSAV